MHRKLRALDVKSSTVSFGQRLFRFILWCRLCFSIHRHKTELHIALENAISLGSKYLSRSVRIVLNPWMSVNVSSSDLILCCLDRRMAAPVVIPVSENFQSFVDRSNTPEFPQNSFGWLPRFRFRFLSCSTIGRPKFFSTSSLLFFVLFMTESMYLSRPIVVMGCLGSFSKGAL